MDENPLCLSPPVVNPPLVSDDAVEYSKPEDRGERLERRRSSRDDLCRFWAMIA